MITLNREDRVTYSAWTWRGCVGVITRLKRAAWHVEDYENGETTVCAAQRQALLWLQRNDVSIRARGSK